MGDTLSTGGSWAHGDLTGAPDDGLDTSVGLSGWPLGLRAFACAFAPGFKIVLVPLVTPDFCVLDVGAGAGMGVGVGAGVNVDVDVGVGVGAVAVAVAVADAGAGAGFAITTGGSFFSIGFGSSAGGTWFSAATVDFVPSIHCTVSGVQSSSSSSMSAHFASFPPSSACKRVAK